MANTAPVWVYDKDIATGELLQEPRRLDGESGTDYHVSPAAIKQYEYVDNSGQLTGVFGNLPQTSVLYYRPNDWRAVHRIDMFVETLTKLPVYPTPSDLSPIITTISPKEFWHTHLRVITSNGQFWYQIGDHHWLRYDSSQMALSDNAPDQANVNYFNNPEKVESDQPNAIVNFLPGQSTEVFESPYGLPVGSVLDGDFVAISDELHDANGVVWLKLATKGWINGVYIDRL
ncbi:MucBP domain-containing protein [Leuconostoc falkenbergense]|uniref:MucBP domain-containing protein n=1 Tax=Leuconostoc falkenbergense TaxID=2766470 RepID=UPI003F969E89